MGVYIGDVSIPFVTEFSVDKINKPTEVIKHLGNVPPHVAEFQSDVFNTTMTGTLFQASGDIRDVDQYAEDMTALVDRFGVYNYINDYQNRSGWLILDTADSTKSANSILIRDYSMSGRFMSKSKYQTRMHTAPVIRSNSWSHVLGTDDCDNYVAIPIGATYSGGDGSTITRSSEDGDITLVLATTDNDIKFDLVDDEVDVGGCKVFDMMSENLLKNDDFEDWSDGDSSTPDDWSLYGTPSVAKETIITQLGSASIKITPDANTEGVHQLISDYLYYRNKYMTFGCWVYSSVAGNANIAVSDGIGVSYSDYHTGGGDMEWLTVTKLVNAGATSLSIRLYPARVSGTDFAYFDGAVLVEGSEAPVTPVLDTYGVQVYSRDREFTGSMIIQNGLYRIMLNPSTDHITVYYWDGSEYIHISAFTAGTFTRATITENTPDCITVELDSGVDIELRRGHPPLIDTGTTDLITVGLTPADQTATTDNYLDLGTNLYICSDETFSIVNATQNLDDGKKWIIYNTNSGTAEDMAHQALVNVRLNRELIAR